MNTTQSTQHTLPATDRQVPAGIGAYSIKAYKSMLTDTGLRDTAKLYRGATLVGSVNGDDFGGQTYLRPESMDEHALFVNACGDETEEDVLNALMLNALAAQEMNKVLRKGKLLFVRAGEAVTEPRTINLPMSKTTLSDIKTMLAKEEFQTGLAKKFGAGSRFWDSQVWVNM
ncbi:hypothetical protein [Ornithinimicrobium murale]|uniref:hypothetical protein n=1 Tax=Ornithinimicrobium murale TaxID=1050153 RepID=UPI000E0D2F36|nr:hypothetical protein [Ornithinimicrobium murale]